MADRPERQRVVVTGLGPVTPVGTGREAAWRGVVDGVSGADEITLVDHEDFGVHFACEVKDFQATDWMEKKEARHVDRFTHFAVASAQLAIRDAGVDLDALDKDRCGIVYGSGIGGVLSMEEQFRRFHEKGPRRISPFTIPYLMVNCACGTIAIDTGFRGVNYAPVTACATASHALGLALRHIQWGEADLMLAGGSEAGISVLGLGGFTNMGALSTRNDDPKHASRPFDRDRDGFVMGEGAGCVVLESLEHAKARGATIYAEFLGYGMTDDAYHITAPMAGGAGGARAMKIALSDAGVAAEAIDYINCHGTSTPYNDKSETEAVKDALGEKAARAVSLSSTKGGTGHLLGAAGGVEFAFACMAVREGIVPPTINYETPDPECDLDYTPNTARERPIRHAMSNSLGFGGHNCSLVIGAYTE